MNETSTKIPVGEDEVKMGNSPAEKILYVVFFSLIVGVVLVTFYKYFISRNYYIEARADCDPAVEKCFIYQCDPATDSECSQDPAEQISYYKKVKKKAYLIPLCDPNSEDCSALECNPGEDCEEILCDETTAVEGEECSDPEEYLEENPVDEDKSSDEESDYDGVAKKDSGGENDNL